MHRIRNSKSFEGTEDIETFIVNGQPAFTAVGPDYQANHNDSDYIYDRNGNIQTLNRKGNENSMMDELVYHYGEGDRSNLLKYVHDKQSDQLLFNNDVESQGPLGNDPNSENYKYDKIGNLVSDIIGDVQEIKWNIQGKVDEIIFESGAPNQSVNFTYDAAGNRLSKITTKQDGTTDVNIYVRDAQGNVLSQYGKSTTTNYNAAFAGRIAQKEVPLYGSSRIGLQKFFGREVFSGNTLSSFVSTKVGTENGSKKFELSNHLGNVLAVVSDKKRGFSDGTTASNYVDNYLAEVVSANDYFPFGMQMPSRSFDSPDYRYGFNGKEKDENGEWGETPYIDPDTGEEKVNILTHYDYGFRIYNPGIGRFLSVDPLTNEYPFLTPYQFASNSPIAGIDLDGLEFQSFHESNLRISDGQTWLTTARYNDLYGSSINSTGWKIRSTIRKDGLGNSYTGATLPVQINLIDLNDGPDTNPLSNQLRKN